MKKEELRNILRKKGVPDYYYNIDAIGEVDQRVCLTFDGEKWEVCYSERGKKFDVIMYQTEDEACEEVLKRLVYDKSKCVKSV